MLLSISLSTTTEACVTPPTHRWEKEGFRRPRPARPGTCGVSARSRQAQGRGRAEAATQARPDRRALGGRRGSVRSGRRTRMPARLPACSPESGAKGRLLPNNSALHRRNNAGGEPRAAGREPESGARLRGCSCAQPASDRRARVAGGEGAAAGGSGAEPGRPRGSPREGRPGAHGRAARDPRRPAPRPEPGRGRERGRRHKAAASGAMNRAFSQCVVRACRPAPASGAAARQARAGRGDSGPGRARSPRRQRPPPTSPPTRPPFRPAAAGRLGPRRAPALGRRGPSHCDTAAPGRACAAASPRPAPPPLTRISLGPKWLRRRLHLVAGPGPG